MTQRLLLKMMNKRHRTQLATPCYVILLCASAVALADPTLLAQGQASYEDDCAACHGRAGTGDGPLAAGLTLKPADLTALMQANHSKFPEAYVRRVIDGRDLPPSVHGETTMPVWGRHYRRSALAYSEQIVENKISALVAYLRSIQRD